MSEKYLLYIYNIYYCLFKKTQKQYSTKYQYKIQPFKIIQIFLVKRLIIRLFELNKQKFNYLKLKSLIVK